MTPWIAGWKVSCWSIALTMLFAGCQSRNLGFPTTATKPPVAESLPSQPACVPSPPPFWFNQGGQFEGRGMSTVSLEEAGANARIEIAKQLEVSVGGEDTIILTESTASGFVYSVASKIAEKVEIKLSGLEPVRQDEETRCGPRHYAMWRLNPAQALHRMAWGPAESRRSCEAIQNAG